MKIKSITYNFIFAILAFSVLTSSCIFSPETGEKGPKPVGQWIEPTTPRKVITNLELSFSLLDVDFYEKCLHENYFYRSPSDIDEFDLYWSRSEDIRVIGNMMDKCKEIIFTPSEIHIYEEYGKNVQNKPDGATLDENNDHPDDIWYVCDYYITIDIFTKEIGDFKVQQDMKFKIVENPETHLYSIIRWVDDNQIVK